jgi:hypothetical protein
MCKHLSRQYETCKVKQSLCRKGRSVYPLAVLRDSLQYNDSFTDNVLQAWYPVTVLSQGIKARITKQEMVLGTGQMLQLDASQSQDLDRSQGTLQVLCPCVY